MRLKGYKISEEAVYQGLLKTKWPGRFELLREEPIFIRDGAHNDQGVKALANSLKDYFPGKRVTFIMGVLADKSYDSMLQLISPLADQLILVTPDNPRALKAEELSKYAKPYCSNIYVADNIYQGVNYALEHSKKEDVICAFGSLYFIEDIRL